MKAETSLQNEIRIALSKRGCVCLRSNVGMFYTIDGRQIRIGEDGQSDLHGHRPDGQAFYIEVKTKFGKPTLKQIEFLKAMRSTGARAGIAYTPEEAINIVFEK